MSSAKSTLLCAAEGIWRGSGLAEDATVINKPTRKIDILRMYPYLHHLGVAYKRPLYQENQDRIGFTT